MYCVPVHRALGLAVLFAWCLVSNALAQNALGQSASIQSDAKPSELEYRVDQDQLYRTGELDEYAQQRCRLDVYYPLEQTDLTTVVWFHGGGLTGGERSIPSALQKQGIIVVAANYRLSPQVQAPVYLEDAAAAVAWTFKNIERYGGSSERIYVAGHSAGGYLASMIGLDRRWLAQHEIDANRIAGLIPYSGHTITHFTIRKERGIGEATVVIDDLAPLNHVRADAPPLLLITGDRDLELLGRYEENAYLWRMMKVSGHQQTELFELEGYDHGAMAEPAHPLLLKWIKSHR